MEPFLISTVVTAVVAAWGWHRAATWKANAEMFDAVAEEHASCCRTLHEALSGERSTTKRLGAENLSLSARVAAFEAAEAARQAQRVAASRKAAEMRRARSATKMAA